MPQKSYVEIARFGDAMVFRVIGIGNMVLSPAVWGLAEKMMGEGVCKIAFELSACTGLDSTFMGMLVGLNHQVEQREQGGWVCAVNASDKARAHLHTLGADKFISIKETFPVDDITMQRLNTEMYSQEDRLKVIKQAHATLVAMDEANRERFGSFLKSLEKELEE